uniref:RING-type domain-containing protein n=1 Tax=Meloidogyne javanica TaxID=6303 RepID=A0A915LQ48_MELJA
MFTIRNLLTIRNFSLRNLSPAPSPVVSESGASTSSQTNWELRASRRSPRPIRTEGYHQPITRAASDIQEIQQQSSSISDRPIIDAAPRPKRPAGYIRVRHRMIVDELARARLHKSTSADNTDLPEGQQIPADTPEIAAEYFRGFKTPGGLTDREIEARKRTIVLLPTTFKGSDEICNCCLNGYRAGQSIIFAKCGHKYHLDCFNDFVKNWRACALCRKDMATGKNL